MTAHSDDDFDLGMLPIDPPAKRETCLQCQRPIRVCWCPYLPEQPIEIQCNIIIIQHPKEEKRCLRTAPMIQAGLQPGKCQIIKATKSIYAKNTLLSSVLQSPSTILLYPHPNAKPITEFLPVTSTNQSSYNLILLDGTWSQAHAMYIRNPALQDVKCVKLEHEFTSQFIIRTQPTEYCLSTVESAAVALSWLEGKPNIFSELTRPLRALCHFQLEHGAVKHDSKEMNLQKNFQSIDDLPKRTRQKIAKIGIKFGT